MADRWGWAWFCPFDRLAGVAEGVGAVDTAAEVAGDAAAAVDTAAAGEADSTAPAPEGAHRKAPAEAAEHHRAAGLEVHSPVVAVGAYRRIDSCRTPGKGLDSRTLRHHRRRGEQPSLVVVVDTEVAADSTCSVVPSLSSINDEERHWKLYVSQTRRLQVCLSTTRKTDDLASRKARWSFNHRILLYSLHVAAHRLARPLFIVPSLTVCSAQGRDLHRSKVV